MTFDSFVGLVADQPFFDLATAVQLSGEKRAGVCTQLYRWTKQGKLFSLRRGMYALADRFRRVPINPAELANHLYRPSYLSGLWALGFYGLIPEKVVTFTCVTPRVPRRFQNELGSYEYRNVKQGAFFGYRNAGIRGSQVLLAEPEKALLDLWHLGQGTWGEDRMTEMRFQNQDAVNPEKLEEYADRFHSPRLLCATKTWCRLARLDRAGTVEL
jgi:predicted transcriptional regulator of viral defense system